MEEQWYGASQHQQQQAPPACQMILICTVYLVDLVRAINTQGQDSPPLTTVGFFNTWQPRHRAQPHVEAAVAGAIALSWCRTTSPKETRVANSALWTHIEIRAC